MSEQPQQNPATPTTSREQSSANSPRDYKSYKLIAFVLILIVGTFLVIRKENVYKVASEKFIKESIPVLNNFSFISAAPSQNIDHRLSEQIRTKAKLMGLISGNIENKNLKRIFCKYRNNDTLFCVDLYSNKEDILFYLKPPVKVHF